MGRSLSVGTTSLVAANILPQAIRQFRSPQPDQQNSHLYFPNKCSITKRAEEHDAIPFLPSRLFS
jgi:hypothetical protein